VQQLRRRVQVGIRRREFAVAQPARDRVQRPTLFELPAAGLVTEVVEVQVSSSLARFEAAICGTESKSKSAKCLPKSAPPA